MVGRACAVSATRGTEGRHGLGAKNDAAGCALHATLCGPLFSICLQNTKWNGGALCLFRGHAPRLLPPPRLPPCQTKCARQASKAAATQRTVDLNLGHGCPCWCSSHAQTRPRAHRGAARPPALGTAQLVVGRPLSFAESRRADECGGSRPRFWALPFAWLPSQGARRARCD